MTIADEEKLHSMLAQYGPIIITTKLAEGATAFANSEYDDDLMAENEAEKWEDVAEMFDELSDEVDMCRRHLKKLAKDIQSSGIP